MRRAIAVLFVVGAALGLWLWARPREHSIERNDSVRDKQSVTRETPVDAPPRTTRAAPPEALIPDASALPSAAAPTPAQRAARRELEETGFMTELRRVAASDPVRGLELAREGQRRFPNGEAAAERAAIVVRSLAMQGRLSEARGEAELMVQRYAGTSWAREVEQQTGAHPRIDH
jgi:hypothetical protein